MCRDTITKWKLTSMYRWMPYHKSWNLLSDNLKKNKNSYLSIFFCFEMTFTVYVTLVMIWLYGLTIYEYHCRCLIRRGTAYPSQSPEFTPGILERSMLLVFLVFCVALLCVFTFCFPCCDVRYDFRIKTTFGYSLPPVVCRRANVLLMLFVFVCV